MGLTLVCPSYTGSSLLKDIEKTNIAVNISYGSSNWCTRLQCRIKVDATNAAALGLFIK